MKNKSLTTGLIWAAILATAIYLTSCTVNHYYVFVVKKRPADEIRFWQPLQQPILTPDWGITPYYEFRVDTINQEWHNPLQITLDEWNKMITPNATEIIDTATAIIFSLEPTSIDSSKTIIDHEK